MNRATADNQSAQAEEEGLQPTKEWVKDLIDEIIADEFASPDLELHWLDEDADARQSEASLESRVKLGALTLNEMREHLGLDPYGNPAADRPMVLTATGYVPIEANAGGEDAEAGDDPALTQPETGTRRVSFTKTYDPDEPRVPKHNLGAGEWTKDETSEAADNIDNAPQSSSGDHPNRPTDGRSRSKAHNMRLAGNFRCEGFSAGCQSGGSYGTTPKYNVYGRNLCWDCAVKILGIQDASSSEKVLWLTPHLIVGK